MLGKDLFETCYKGYTEKQWQKPAKELPSSIAKRIPIRLNFNDLYFDDEYQGIPINGYTNMIMNIIDHKNIKININTDFYTDKKDHERSFDYIFYSGKPDQYFDYRFGLLEYRSLNFVEKTFEQTFQGLAQLNYADAGIPYTRTIEHKFFYDTKIDHSIVTFEYPEKYDETKIPFYPVETKENKERYDKYRNLIENNPKLIFGGRLGKYTYLNMDQVIAMAIHDVEKLCLRMKITKK
jgi:UDP-galactopyranose mutase